MLCLHLTVDVGHLIHVQLTCQHHDIGKLGIKAQGFDIRYVQLGGEMHLLPHPIAIGHHRHVGGNDGRDAGLSGCIDDLVHQRDVLAIDDGIDSKITLDAVFVALTGNIAQVVDGERRGRVRPHVQFLNAEIDAASPSLDGCSQRLARADRSHDFKVFYLHGCKDSANRAKYQINLDISEMLPIFE